MAKGQKSSATTATRKKHARKAAGDAKQELPLPKEKKKEKGKGKNKEPRVKAFIPPTKPAPVRPDPLDSLGIAKDLPPELLIVLRRLAKKDSVTKRKALEELQTFWVDKVLKEDDENGIIEVTLQTSLPVWLHHVPSLLLSASRRIRLLAATIHGSLLRIPSIHEQIVFFLQETGDTAQVEAILGSWSMAAEDVERSVANQARQAWDLAFRAPTTSSPGVDLSESSLGLLLAFIKRALFDPGALYADLNPVQPAFTPLLPAHASPRNKGAAKRPPPPLLAVEEALTRKTEEEDESESDRSGRLRSGALGVLRWVLEKERAKTPEQLSELLASPLLWTALYQGPSPPFCNIQTSSGYLGQDQPTVRKTAWNVLRTLLKYNNAYMGDPLLSILSSAILRSAWVEHDLAVRSGMWEPLLKFLTQFPKGWEIDLSATMSTEEGGESDEESESSEEEDVNDDVKADASPPNSEAFREFLTFLALGCHGSPFQGYPTVVVILSTIPPSILGRGPEAWTDLLTSFWAALDGRALTSLAPERAAASNAFLVALLECIIFLVKRSRAFSEEASTDDRDAMQEAIKTIVGQHMGRVWDEIVKDHLRVPSNAVGKALAPSFTSFEALHDSLFLAAWEAISSSVTAACLPQHGEAPSVSSKRFTMQLSLLRTLWDESRLPPEATWPRALSTLINTISSVLVERAKEQFQHMGMSRTKLTETTASQRLAEMLACFNDMIFDDTNLSSRIDELMHENVIPILRTELTIQLFLTFLSRRDKADPCLTVWHDALKLIASNLELHEEALPSLLGAAERGDLPKNLAPQGDEMLDFATRLTADVLGDTNVRLNETRSTLLKRLLGKPDFFLSPHTTSTLINTIAKAFSERSRRLMLDTDSSESLLPLRTPLMLLSSTIDVRPDDTLEDIRESLPDFFVFGHILPHTELLSTEARALCMQARHIWSSAMSSERLSPDGRNVINASLLSYLRDLVASVDSRASPEVILQLVTEGYLGSSVDLLQDIFPPQDALEDMLRNLPSAPLDPILAIVDPLVPPPSTWKEEQSKYVNRAYDQSGFCKYARIINALLVIATDNRDLVRQNVWFLRHFLVLLVVANEKQLLPSADSAFFSQDVSLDVLQELSSRVKTLTALLVSESDEEGWHVKIVQAYLKGNDDRRDVFADPSLSFFMLDLLDSATKEDSLRDSRVLYTILRRVLNGATCNDAEQWMVLARRIEKHSPNPVLAIIHAVNESALEPPSMDRYRNEIAAGALSIRASKAPSDGLKLLHHLALTAPDPDSDVVFLPQNRAVNLMKACQGWIASDEDLVEDVESEMTLIFQHLAPILQNVPGAHWDFIFDMIENNLENSSLSDSSIVVALARTLKLILVIQDLARTNKSLRAVWVDRERPILILIRDIVRNTSVEDSPASIPRSICWEMAISIIQDLPSSLIDHESLAKMSHLILDPSPEVAKMSYSLLLRAAQKRTEYLVVEAGVDTSSETTKYDIPMEVLQVIQDAMVLERPSVLGYLLGWMIVFDLFDNASLRVKIGYATQLRDVDLVESSFLPFIFDMLEIGRGSRSFPLEPWSVEEYLVEFYDPDSRLSPRLFAAHLFYRALLNIPSLISNWWTRCRDRQLVTAVAGLTTRYYSPVLIASELRHVKDPGGIAELSGENWSVKVAAGVGEVSAAYTVDEQVMEIAVRLPNDYPLHSIEVREVQKLGVEEKRWRGWLLAVQQIVTSQNGRIVDGLSMFKKNVTHHFENQTECAICYSIISVTELSLPKKRCKTCKNRFHAGCLFKWFNTSHTSSCPLCRSDFI